MMIGKDIGTHQTGGPRNAAPSGKIANSREMIIDGTIGKTTRVTVTTRPTKTGFGTGTVISLAGTMISDVMIGHINMDTTEFL